jgi:predicted RNA binding protein YcfA (HicA-like mRNA interferase family)
MFVIDYLRSHLYIRSSPKNITTPISPGSTIHFRKNKNARHKVSSGPATKKRRRLLGNALSTGKTHYGIIDKGKDMPVKIKKLKANLLRAGFVMRPAKGSHTFWTHPFLPGVTITLAGKDGSDARPYQIHDVQHAIKQLGGMRDES